MAATSAYLRHDTIPAHSALFVGIAMLALAVGCGYTIALGELAGLYVGLSLVCTVAVRSIMSRPRVPTVGMYARITS